MNTSVKQRRAWQQQGFTIVELMIATMIFSVILLIITSGVIHFSNSYYKGINSSTTQNTTRSIIDTVVQSIQFGTSDPQAVTEPSYGGVVAQCVGNQLFVPFLGAEVTGSPTHKEGLLQFSVSNCSEAPPIDTGKQLLQRTMHLADFSVTRDSVLYTVSIKVAFADNDSGGGNSLLCAPTQVPGSCAPGASLPAADFSGSPASIVILKDLHCKGDTGSQFCSVSGLSTTAGRRVL